MSLLAPRWLLILPLVLGLLALVTWRGRRTVPRRQHRVATVLRGAGLVLLVLALAQPVLARPIGSLAVVFLVDRSASVPTEAQAAQDQFVAEAVAAAGRDDRSAVAVFGAEVRLDAALAARTAAEPVRSVVDESGTALEAALDAAAAVLPTEGARRIVVFSDGVETSGDARAAAGRLADMGIVVDVVSSAAGRGPDVLVESVELPATVRSGEVVPVEVAVRSNGAGPAEVVLTVDGAGTQTVALDVAPGRETVTFEVPAPDAGFVRAIALVRSEFDTIPENNRAEGLTRVEGAARVAVVAPDADEADALQRALEAGGLAVDGWSALPDDTALLGYDAAVLVDVPLPSPGEVERLRAFVEDLGRGLVTVGGASSYGLGDYQGSALEELLPVSSDPDDLVRRQPVNEVLVIDTSGSMGRCHCDGDEGIEGGVNKTDISRAGAALAIDALGQQDRVGVLAFSSGTDWVIPFGPVPTAGEVDSALGTLFPDGNTEIARALEEALRQLEGIEEGLRHIVLFTDGWDPNEQRLLPVAREIAAAGVTLSVLGTGEGPGFTLERMADIGGGRYYPGEDLESVPEVFSEETLAVTRNLAQEGSFLPLLGVATPATAELSAAPPLGGYVLTRPKGTAAIALAIGEDDPLLASWQRGLGRVTSWTSDAGPRWSADWLPWEGYLPFWNRVVRDVLPAGQGAPPEVTVSAGVLEVRFEAENAPLDAAALAQVRTPTGETVAVPLRRTGTDEFAGETRVTAPGAYWVAVAVEGPGGPIASGSAGAVSSYGEEFAFREADPALLDDLASITGGQVAPEPPDAFDSVPISARARQPIWMWLVGLALALFLADVALRRLVLTEGDLASWRDAIKVRSPRPAGGPEEAAPSAGAPPPPALPEQQTVDRLLRRKRR